MVRRGPLKPDAGVEPDLMARGHCSIGRLRGCAMSPTSKPGQPIFAAFFENRSRAG